LVLGREKWFSVPETASTLKEMKLQMVDHKLEAWRFQRGTDLFELHEIIAGCLGMEYNVGVRSIGSLNLENIEMLG
jgi:hypothetical protein